MFNRPNANRTAANLTDDQLDHVIHIVCSCFDPGLFPGVDTLDEVRQIVDVLSHERGRRAKATAEMPVPKRLQ
jgi:hypothetical protein